MDYNLGVFAGSSLKAARYCVMGTPSTLHSEHQRVPAITKDKIAMKHAVDLHVGNRIRQQRWLTGITQQQLAVAVGVKFQQIQKYETGMNRVSASRLWDIANTLNVPVRLFFEGLETDTQTQRITSDLPDNIQTDRETIDLLRCYYAMPENQRRRLFDLARALGEAA